MIFTLNLKREGTLLFQKFKDWVFTRYFDVPENYDVYIWDFNHNGTFRIIKPDTRKDAIKRYLDDMENFLYKEMNILQFAK